MPGESSEHNSCGRWFFSNFPSRSKDAGGKVASVAEKKDWKNRQSFFLALAWKARIFERPPFLNGYPGGYTRACIRVHFGYVDASVGCGFHWLT